MAQLESIDLNPFHFFFSIVLGEVGGVSGFILTHVYNMTSAGIADQILVERASQILRATLARSASHLLLNSRFRRMRLPLDAAHWQYKLQEVESQALSPECPELLVQAKGYWPCNEDRVHFQHGFPLKSLVR